MERIDFKPHAYQAKAIEWVLDKPRCCLFLDMGLGKSVITLTAIQRLLDWCEISSALVVAPKKVAESTWTAEAEKWRHLAGLRVMAVTGGAKRRRAALATEADVYVIGRDSFVWLCGEYKRGLPFDMCVIDELTSFKSPTSLRFKAMRASTPRFARVVGLTGTPAPNGLADLWAQLYCVDMGERLGKFVSRYRQEYFDQRVWNNIVVKLTPKKGAEQAIRKKIAGICLSMQAKDYLTLPDMMTIDKRIELPDSVRRGYEEFERESVLELGDEPILAASAAALMNKLAQYAGGAVYNADHEAQEVHTEKLDALEEIVEQAKSPVLVFYQFKHEASRVMARLKGLNVQKYDGPRQLDDWNARKIDVLLAHPASTAFGLNMQRGGNYIVWFGTGWNLELYQQANARLHRQGQTKPVIVYRLIAAGTVDERALAAIEKKESVQDALLRNLKELKDKYEQTTDSGV